MSLGEINENVKLAREYALLGNYNSAVVCYQGVLEQIKKYQYSVRDSSLQQKWQQVRVSSTGHRPLPDLHCNTSDTQWHVYVLAVFGHPGLARD